MQDELYSGNDRTHDLHFFTAEYRKRQFEEYADIKDIEWYQKNLYLPFEGSSLSQAFQIDIINECVIVYESMVNRYAYRKSIDIPFNIGQYSDWVSKLYQLLLKYKMPPGVLGIPYDATEILEAIINNRSLPSNKIWEPQMSAVEYLDAYGFYAQQIDQNNYSFTFDFSRKYPRSDNLLAQVAQVLASIKDKHGILSETDKEVLNAALYADVNIPARSTTPYKKALGLCIWDMMKENRKRSQDKIRIDIVNKGLYYYTKQGENKKELQQCSSDQCRLCPSAEGCPKVFADIYKKTSSAIFKGEMFSGSDKIKLHKPFRESFFKRVSLDFFKDEDCCSE